jgi:hypothetical protein
MPRTNTSRALEAFKKAFGRSINSKSEADRSWIAGWIAGFLAKRRT